VRRGGKHAGPVATVRLRDGRSDPSAHP
jgi:hypothetical protein